MNGNRSSQQNDTASTGAKNDLSFMSINGITHINQ